MLVNRLLYRVLVLASLSVPLYFVVGAMQFTQQSWELNQIGIRTLAKIIQVESYLIEDDDGDYYIYFYTVEYLAEDNKYYRYRLDRSRSLNRTKGEKISIVYHPEDPKIVKIDKAYQLVWYPIWNLLGTAALWAFIMFFWFAGFLYPVIGKDHLGF